MPRVMKEYASARTSLSGTVKHANLVRTLHIIKELTAAVFLIAAALSE